MKNPVNIALGVVGMLMLLAMLFHLFGRGFHSNPDPAHWVVEGGDARRGRHLMVTHGCASCHVIPGIREAKARVGPQLHGFRHQIYIAGRLQNTPENLVRWIHDPEAIDPLTAMPTVAMTEQDARDLAAYLLVQD